MDDHDPQLWGIFWDGHWGEVFDSICWHIALLALQKKGEIIVKNGATFSLTVVFVVFCLGGFWWRYHDAGIQVFGGRTSSDFLMDGVIGFVVTYSYLGWSWLSPGKRLEQSWKTLKLQQSLLHLLFEGCAVNMCIYLFVLIYTWILQNVYIYLNKQMWHDMTHMTDHLVSAGWWGVQCLSVARTILPGSSEVFCSTMLGASRGEMLKDSWIDARCHERPSTRRLWCHLWILCGCPAKRISVTRRIWGEDGLTFILSTGWKS